MTVKRPPSPGLDAVLPDPHFVAVTPRENWLVLRGPSEWIRRSWLAAIDRRARS